MSGICSAIIKLKAYYKVRASIIPWVITKEKQPLLLNLACASEYNLRLGFACIFYYPRKDLAFI